VPLFEAGGVGLFVKELESALQSGEVDLAVHSLKDMPGQLPAGLEIAAVPEREDPRDVLVSRLNLPLAELPAGARVGTSSRRRAAQLLSARPDLVIVNLRGNVDTRLRRAQSEPYDAIVLAAAGLIRLGHADRITETLPPEVMLPAVGQGALAVEVRTADERTRGLVAALGHSTTRCAVTAERSFLGRLGGGCHVPIAAYAVVERDDLWLRGLVSSVDGQVTVRGERRGRMIDLEAVGSDLAEELLGKGAAELLEL
jgi:hydroxymethylbilane synthase